MKSGIRCHRAVVMLFLFAFGSGAADTIQLPKPQTTGGKPLMQAISERHSTRELSATANFRPRSSPTCSGRPGE